MAKLRVDKIASVGVSTETTGSVFFDGSSDWLRARGGDNFSDFDFGSSDFTIEGFFYANDVNGTDIPIALAADTVSANSDAGWYIRYQSNKIEGQAFSSSNNIGVTTSGTVSNNTWYHVAYVREGSTFTLYVDGTAVDTATSSSSLNWNSGWKVEIGSGYGEANHFAGYISNLRICKGHAVYKSNFAVPTRELDVHPGPEHDRTVLLACYDGENIFAEKTGRHILASQGNRSSSPTLASGETPVGITTLSPGLTRDVDNTFGPTFQGGAGYSSQNWLTLPKGTTTERFVEVANNAVSASSARGINGGGYIAPSNTNTMQYITIATTGNAADFGDLSAIRNAPGAVASSTRGIWMGGVGPSPGNTALDVIDYVTIASTGNAADFGDLINNHRADSAAGDSTRGLRLGQQQSPAVGNTIEYITIASTGDAKDFGDLVQGRSQSGAFASPTRAVQFGGYGGPSVSNVNTIDYVTIQTMGNSIDFGDLKDGVRTGARGCSNATRGVFGGGYNPTPYASDLDYVTIASTGNSLDFGNLSMGNRYGSSCSSLTRGIFFIGESTSPTPGNRQNIDYVTIAALANANDFGDLISSYSGYTAAACSNGHGGLG